MTVQADDDTVTLPSVVISLEPGTEAWQGLVMAGAAEMVRVLEQARSIAARLEQDLAEACRHLTAVLAVAVEQGSTFATASRDVDAAREWLAANG